MSGRWRFLGELKQGKNREEIRSQTLEDWVVWRWNWIPLSEPAIAVPDPDSGLNLLHAKRYIAKNEGRDFAFAVVDKGDCRLFYVPVERDKEGFEAPDVRYEGFWRRSEQEESVLPWPEPTTEWNRRPSFLLSLDQAESIAERVAYRGYSYCRLCGRGNGFETLCLNGWEWPSGLRHYIDMHNVRPSTRFEAFITSTANSLSENS